MEIKLNEIGDRSAQPGFGGRGLNGVLSGKWWRRLRCSYGGCNFSSEGRETSAGDKHGSGKKEGVGSEEGRREMRGIGEGGSGEQGDERRVRSGKRSGNEGREGRLGKKL
ncbi:uncharacterized protein LOC131148165 [Malania oleifera]|uniref:uncharacterized protein LOC131148165 n=1 Tax=Malania oleifera TaxID=397392 RepID=UPI0025ADDC0A|nr:uncharacterized protein LOC131148165 [Malania oleifera]